MEQDRARSDRRLDWVSNCTKALFALAGRIGLDPSDGDETALQKRLVVVLCVGTLPLTMLWSAIYFAAGVPLAAAIPGFYFGHHPNQYGDFRVDPQSRLLSLHPAPYLLDQAVEALKDLVEEIDAQFLPAALRNAQPHGILRPKPDRSDHPQHLRADQGRIRLRSQGDYRGEGRGSDGGLARDRQEVRRA